MLYARDYLVSFCGSWDRERRLAMADVNGTTLTKLELKVESNKAKKHVTCHQSSNLITAPLSCTATGCLPPYTIPLIACRRPASTQICHLFRQCDHRALPHIQEPCTAPAPLFHFENQRQREGIRVAVDHLCLLHLFSVPVSDLSPLPRQPP